MATLDTVSSYSSSFLSLATQLGISFSISLYCLLQFEWNRRKKSMKYLYSPRTKLAKNPSPQIPSGLFSWIKATIFLDDDFYLNHVGLDALMYIRFLRMAFRFVLFNAIIVGTILMPINFTASRNEVGVPRLSLSNIDSTNTDILWAHSICTYIVSISWMYLLYINYYDYMKLHREYLLKKVSSGSITERTVMISRIPRDLRSEDKFQSYVSSLGLGEVESVRMVRHTGKLDRRIMRREKALLSLEMAHICLAKNVYNAIKRKRLFGTGIWARLFGYANEPNLEIGEARDHQKIQSLVDRLDPRKRRRINTGDSMSDNNESVTRHPKFPTSGTFSSDLMHEDGYGRQYLIIWNALRHISKNVLDKYQPTHRTGFFGNKVVSIDVFLKKFNYLDRRIAELRSKPINGAPYKATSTGFVTFKDHISAQLCAQSIMNSEPHTCTTRMAPEPRDILWDNLTKKFREKLIRYIIVNACVWALTIFWLLPIAAFLGLTTIDSLSKKIKFLGPILATTPLIRSLLQNVLPTVLVTFFMCFLPWILMELSKLESPASYSELEEAVLIRYYHFSFFNVFLVFLLGTTFLTSILDVINTPASILNVLAVSLPRGATFFINYIVFNTCTHGLELVQVGSQIFLHIILTSRFIATTPRMLQRVTHPWSFQFYYYYPNHILVLVITITYSVINPLILVFSLLYYAFALIVFKHQFAYCYVRRYEAGGKFYRRVFRYTTDGLIIFQLTIIGTIWLRKGIAEGAILVPLLLGTGYFKYYCHKTFYSRTHYLALDSRLSLQNHVQDEQRVNVDENAIREKMPSNSTQNNAEIKGKTTVPIEKSSNMNGYVAYNKRGNITKDGFRELEENNSIDSDTSTKITFTKSNGITKDNIESDDQNEENIQNSKKRNSLQEKLNNLPRPSSLSQSMITSSEHNEESVGDNEVIITDGNFETSTTLFTSIDDQNNNTSAKQPKVILVGENSSSSQPQKKSKDNNKLIIIPPENGEFLTASPVESISGHGSRLPSSGNLRSFHPAHFTHDPNFKVIQDETSTFQTYTHPNLVKALNRKLWLPRNPLKKICVEDNVELSKALTSSEGGLGLVGYWGGASLYLGEAKLSAYGDHEFPSKLIHTREGERESQIPRCAQGDKKDDQHSDNESDYEGSECSFDGPISPEDENIVSLNEFKEPDELSSGEEY